MSAHRSMKLSLLSGVLLGASSVDLTAFAQSPTLIAESFFSTPSASPRLGVQAGGVAIPAPVLSRAPYLPGGAHEDPDLIRADKDFGRNFKQALEVTRALGIRPLLTRTGRSPAWPLQLCGSGPHREDEESL
jgi:hypothetical protein